ncbi:MAG: cytochrome c [Gammaproteobacteria bacterium]|nr:cytochrome c [Gammaproteobacteria bacterium]
MTGGASARAPLAAAIAWLAVPASGASPAEVTPAVQASYMLNCMGCHLADGSGAPGKVPSMRNSLRRLALSAAGRSYLVRVPGAAQSPLSDLELAHLLTWMVRNLSAAPVPRAFADFTAAEVSRYRRSPLAEVRSVRARLLSMPAPR